MKKVVIIVVLLLLLCCVCTSVLAGVFGYLEINNSCVYKGPLSNATSGKCMKIETTTYNGTAFSFDYPKTWVTSEKNGLLYVYEKDPSTLKSGDFNQNIVVTSEDIANSQVKDMTCAQYGTDYILPATQQTYTATIKDSKEISLNGKRTCYLVLEGTNKSGNSVRQVHYGVFDKNTLYYFTISLNQSTTDYTDFTNAANSFKIK